ncbi:MAG: TspO/MBR family protein [Hyphomicrobiales bacterium]|jgi:benzodiazapine receptor
MTTAPMLAAPLVPAHTKSWLVLAIYVLATAAASVTGSFASNPDTSAWYQALNQPPFQPPSWAFGVVWPILYLLMAYAGWRADTASSQTSTFALRLRYGIQLALNAAWTIAFFALQSITGGIIVILALLVAIIAWMATARQIDRLAFWLFVPYAAWVTFATLLNGSYVLLN